jgi:hypothetical protein
LPIASQKACDYCSLIDASAHPWKMAHPWGMKDDVPSESQDRRFAAEQVPESYLRPLIALILLILPQVLVPPRMREGPPLLVPIVEAVVARMLLAVAAKPGPVPRGAARSSGPCLPP